MNMPTNPVPAFAANPRDLDTPVRRYPFGWLVGMRGGYDCETTLEKLRQLKAIDSRIS